jgi:hypothetical protein
LIPVFQENEPSNLKERLLWPFAKRYRNRLELAKFPNALRLIANEVLVFPEQNFLLVKNSKSGCTSAANILHQCFLGKRFEGDIHRTDIGLVQGRNHLKAVRSALLDPDVFKITTVRHPVTRVISGFNDFFVDRKNPRSSVHFDAVRHFGYSTAKSESENFSSFLEMLEYSFSKDPRRIDRHFRLQILNTAIASVNYNAICHVEDLRSEIIESLTKAGVSSQLTGNIAGEVRNASRSKGLVPNTEQLKIIGNLFEKDLSAFGYDLENF